MSPDDRPEGEAQHRVGESFFDPLGPSLVRAGWSVFPQNRDERRGPGLVDGRGLRWKEFATRLPTEEEVRWWAINCPTHNVAAIMGTASGDAIALDVDIADERLSLEVQRLADEFLGPTDFRRVGRHPRIVLLYRQAPEAEQRDSDRIPSRSFRFVGQDANGLVVKSDDGLEILSRGKPITFYGNHHKTGQYFKWIGKQPAKYGPEHAPLITQEQMVAFLEAVQAVRPFHRNATAIAADTSWVYDESAGLQVPRITLMAGGSEWMENEEGIVVDGREKFLFYLAGRIVRSNEAAARDESRKGYDSLCRLTFEQFKAKAEMSGKWDEGHLRREVSDKVSRAIRDAIEKNAFRKPVSRDGGGGKFSMAPERGTEATDGLGFLPKAGETIQGQINSKRLRKKVEATFADATEEKRKERALQPDRREIAASVAQGLKKAMDAFFQEVYDHPPGQPRNIHLLKAPTGAGKTSQTIAYIAKDPRTKKFDPPEGQEAQPAEGEERENPGPLVILLPTYHNIDELRLRADVLNLDKGLSDEELVQQALERNIVHESQIEARLADLRRDASSAGLRTMVYRGKVNAGCKMSDKLNLLMGAGIGSAGLCKASVASEEGEREEKYCVYYHECPAIQQRKDISKCHVVFLPHAFLTLSVPEELQNVRCVIADERVFHLFLHTTTFKLQTLKLARREPRLTKKERDLGMLPQDLLQERDAAAEIAVNALKAGVCPARRLADVKRDMANGKKLLGLNLVESAIRVCSNAIMSSNTINPDMSLDEVRAICESPTGVEVREEARFWKIVHERIKLLEEDRIEQGLVAAASQNGHGEAAAAHPPKAKGHKDMRIQFILEETKEGSRSEMIRISWRSQANWPDASLLLLDASASPEITSKTFHGRNVIVHDIEAALNVRTIAVIDSTYSNSAIVSHGHASAQDRMVAGKLKDRLRKLLSAASCLYGWGRVVVGANVVIRRAVNLAWQPPSNLDWCHYGAMRGLDFAKNHTAAVSLGRMEVPVRTIDGIVAALTYDDDEPELPFDVNGDSIDPVTGEDLRVPQTERVLKMRNGSDMTIQVPLYPGRWARIVQHQYREEELKQFLGRLRPVYREGEAPVWIACSKVIPEDVIVDDVVALDDLIRPGRSMIRLWDACRLAGGVIHPDLLPVAAPALYKDRLDAASEMKKMGFGEDGSCGLDKRDTWGFTPVRVVGPDQGVTHAFVRTEIKDPEAAVVGAFRHWLDWHEDDMSVEVFESVVPRRAGVRREEDWVDQQLGTHEERARAETVLLQKASEEAIVMNPPEAFEIYAGQTRESLPIQVKVVPTGDSREIAMTLDDMVSTESTTLMWNRLMAGHKDLVISPVLDLAANYEHLSDTPFDET